MKPSCKPDPCLSFGPACLLACACVGMAPTLFAWNPTPNGPINAIHPLGDGRVLVAGSFSEIGGIRHHAIAMLNPDGTVDTRFDLTLEPAPAGPLDHGAEITAMTVSGNAIFLSGTFTSVNGFPQQRIARLTFLPGNDGWVLNHPWGEPLFSPANQIIHPIRNQPVYFVGPFGVRIVDLERGNTIQDVSLPAGYDKSILWFRGALYVGGIGGVGDATGIQKLIYNNTDFQWEVDTNFNAGGVGFNSWVQALEADVAGEVFVAAGNFTRYNGQVAPHLVQLTLDGPINGEPGAWPKDAPDGTVHVLYRDTPPAPGWDPAWFLAGAFSHLGDVARAGYAKLNRDGTSADRFNTNTSLTVFGIPNVRALATDNTYLYLGGAVNAWGSHHSYRNLMRVDKVTGELDTTYPQPGPPSTALLADLFARPGETVRLHVPDASEVPLDHQSPFDAPFPRGFPEPVRARHEIIWRKDGLSFVPSEPDHWTHVIPDVKPQDAGIYTVEMHNVAGTGTVTFKLQVASDPGTVALTIYEPDGEAPFAEIWEGGMLWPVSWGPVTGEPLDIDLSTDGGTTWTTLATGITDYAHYTPYGVDRWGYYSVPVPDVVTTQAVVRLRRTGSSEPAAVSNGQFEIGPPTWPVITDWRETNFGSSENAGPAADGADSDHDGQPNLVEYTFSTSPTEPNPPPPITARVTAGTLQLEVEVPSLPLDVVFTVDRSTDLRNWTQVVTSQSFPSFGTWTVSVPVAGEPFQFLRLNVTRPFP